MPVWLDTRGNSVLSVAICDRCNRKMAYVDLYPDPNFPGMRVCKEDLDQYDPWRLPARQTENIALRWPRPDVSVALQADHVLTENGFEEGNSILIVGVPPAGGQSGDLNTLTNANNNLLPLISTVSPNTGPTLGGTRILITGSNFYTGNTVKVGNSNATNVQVISPYQMWAVTPPSTTTGSVGVSVITTFGTTVHPGAFTYQ